MRILVTGSSGLVGQNLVATLRESHEVLTPSHQELDLLDKVGVVEYLAKNIPEMILHCAGRVGGIQANIREPVRFLTENTILSHNIIMGAFEVGVRKFLNFGSSCMYPVDAPNPLTEDLVLTGQLEPTNEGYAIAKVYSQRLCSYIVRESPEFEYKTCIPCNLYGPYDKFDSANSHLVPAIIAKLFNAVRKTLGEVEIWGDGKARREFMYVGDLADFVEYAVGRFSDMPEIVNVGLGYDYSVNEYYEVAAKVIGFKGDFVHNLSRPVGMKQKLVDISRLTSFGWVAKTSLEEGIEKTVSFYKDQLK